MINSAPPAYTLVWTDTFTRTARKFLQRHPDLAGLFEDVLKQLETDPRAARLHLHPLQGKHKGKHAVSLNYTYRMVLILKITDQEVCLLDVGAHNEVYS